ncbi:MAG: SDR family oxidoreductase [Dehalococcoidia bacterium]|nr:SDR family oxidoreductase [Dehalococcoidia bacterium]
MPSRVEGKIALVMGGGQTPGETVGNGRATALLLAREGARVVVVDRDLGSAQATVGLITEERGEAFALAADATDEAAVSTVIAETVRRYGRLDILHNNIGASIALGDAVALDMTEAAYDRSFAVNLKTAWLAAKYAIPVMREHGGGSIVNISSLAAIQAYPLVGYRTMKAAVIALTENLAAAHAPDNIRVNTILPGLMNTPMAIENRVAQGTPREEVIAGRDKQIPLGKKMGTGWDVAYAALFLHSEEAGFITGISLRVDGGQWISHR